MVAPRKGWLRGMVAVRIGNRSVDGSGGGFYICASPVPWRARSLACPFPGAGNLLTTFQE